MWWIANDNVRTNVLTCDKLHPYRRICWKLSFEKIIIAFVAFRYGEKEKLLIPGLQFNWISTLLMCAISVANIRYVFHNRVCAMYCCLFRPTDDQAIEQFFRMYDINWKKTVWSHIWLDKIKNILRNYYIRLYLLFTQSNPFRKIIFQSCSGI